MKKLSTREITKMSLLAALLCASAYISIPLGFTPVVLTLQTMIINIIAIMLTPYESFLTILIYVLIGAVGIPVFSGGQGGLGKLFGPTGGIIFAFLIGTPAMSFTKKYVAAFFAKFMKPAMADAVGFSVNAIFVGMTIIYVFGSMYMKFISGRSWGEVFMMIVVPFIPLDTVKCIAASIIATALGRRLS